MRKKIALMLVLVMIGLMLPVFPVNAVTTPFNPANQPFIPIPITTTTPAAITLQTPIVSINDTTAHWRWVPGASRYVVEITDNWTDRSITVATGGTSLDIWGVVEQYIDWAENWQNNRWWDGSTWRWDWHNPQWNSWHWNQWNWGWEWADWDWSWTNWDWYWNQNWGWNQWNSWNWNRGTWNWNVTVRARAEQLTWEGVVGTSEWSRGRTVDISRAWNARNMVIEPVPLPEYIDYEPEVEYEPEYVPAPAAEPILRFEIDSVFYNTTEGLAILDAPPFIEGSRTMVPLRAIAEGMGADVMWNSETQQVGIGFENIFFTVTIGQPLPDNMGTPVIVNSRTFVPLRYVMEMLGAEVVWDGDNRAIYIVA